LYHANLTPLGKGSDTVELEVGAGIEVALQIEMIVN
jgi:hypothetical protein